MGSKSIKTAAAFVAALGGFACGWYRPSEPIDKLRDLRPGATWVELTAIQADLNCDGGVDFAALGREAGNVLVGAAMSDGTPPEVLQFGIDGRRQDAICSEPAALALYSQEQDPSEEAGYSIEGFRESTTCKGLRLSGGDCDDIFIYWNHKSNRLAWWRH